LPNSLEPLILDLLEWIGSDPKPYSEVMEAWRTSCPRLTVWEETNERGFVDRRCEEGRGAFICLTEQGRNFLAKNRPTTVWGRSAES